jgi:hypothetical protein
MDRKLSGAIVVAALAATAAAAAVNVQQQSDGQFYTAVHGGGSAALRYDIVIVGDGFTAAQQGDFDARVDDVIAALEARAPYSDRMCAFNVWRVNVVSQESGVDHPKDGVFKNTELDVRYGVPANGEAERCITSDSPAKVYEAAGYAPEHDAIFVLANDAQWGGCAGDLVFSSIAPGFAGIVTHELGHKIGDLADEYTCYVCDGSDSNVSYTGPEPDKANCTIDTQLADIKWNDLIAPGTPLPTTVDTPPGVVGLWEGCMYAAQDIYRPQTSCHMRATGSGFCAVCNREMRAALGAHCTACERADTPLDWLLCHGLPRTKPPWWELLHLRWPIPPCLSCPPDGFRDPLEIVIRELGIERGVTARVVDDGGRVLATAKQEGKGLRIAFDATRGASYWLEVDYPKATRLESALQPEVFSAGKQIVGP